ncbi:class I SAM-dependent methyltransferase [Ramlibacter albus]|uniref:Class I SAM-dependent methyltransferase n=1 Tax=Ramlibacter albus TaxID=2079448 RepID=A0A923M5N9_9BURK|nr:class I SAM-dependent methyltransferase [Ramlibacter albus]MBC5763284.1 class I SAM-dependent methyltransferase [Ramlibacter albus]
MEALIEKKLSDRLALLPVPVRLDLPGGRHVGPEKAPLRLSFADWTALAMLAQGQIGRVAEAYVEKRAEFDGRMRDLMTTVISLLPTSPVAAEGGWWAQLKRHAASVAQHTLQKDAEQVQFHYDVSDDFYALWLDPRRVYSCAYFRDAAMPLDAAQEAKLDHICRKLMLRGGDRFLDIGAGWGGLLLWAAENYGVDATGITLSKNQHAYVQELIDRKGLAGRVRIQLCDYRELGEAQGYDKIASVGMFEHVGAANIPAYFGKIRRLLKPGGLVMNHGITSGRLEPGSLGCGMGDFIDKYIFPGGELLHVHHVLREMAAEGLEMVDTENLRPHYARTLWAWSDALEARLDEARGILVQQLGEERGEKILRAYRLYLAGCAVTFEQGWVSLHQVLATRPDGEMSSGKLRGAQSAYPFTRDYIYR